MRLGHHATASPIAVGTAWVLTATGVNTVVGLLCAILVVYSSTWPDLDHPRFRGKYHPGAAFVRLTGHLGYMLRTGRDKERRDVHRGPSHCIEWCLLMGLAVWGVTALTPLIAPWSMWWGLAVFLGTGSHVLADWPTPSGVPLCATYNWLRHGEVWRRHTLNWFSTDSAGERFLAVPIMFCLSAVLLLCMFGLMLPLARLLGVGVGP